jgi:hypothetical protein
MKTHSRSCNPRTESTPAKESPSTAATEMETLKPLLSAVAIMCGFKPAWWDAEEATKPESDVAVNRG